MTSNSDRATGRLVLRDGDVCVVYERRFTAPIADIWAAVTDSDRLARWIGTWTGDPSSGSVQFTMTAEGDGAGEETYEIRECRPPSRLVLHAANDYGVWDLALDLAEADGVTTLGFSQVMADLSALENIGPGWDYYLDRLVAAESGGDVAEIDWDDAYYPALSGHYAALAKESPSS